MSNQPVPKLIIIIPAHNEASAIARVLGDLQRLDFPSVAKEILVVDDGSTDETAQLARANRTVVVSHVINRGLGAAIGTGLQAALGRGADLIVTFDADGQHAAEDIPEMIRPLLEGRADVVIGNRMTGKKGMPWFRRLANRWANFLTWLVFGVRTSDSQSGLRAFSRPAAEKIRITANNYEVSSEIFREIKTHGLKLVEIPIRPIYSSYSLSKGQGVLTGLKTLFRLIFYKDM